MGSPRETRTSVTPSPRTNMKSLMYSGAVMAAVLATAGVQADEQPMIATAMEFLARTSSTSEVLTLNLTNLLILLVLKALIFGFGLFSVGGTARSADDSPSFSETDLQGGMCFMMHMAGDESKLNCIKKTACAEPTVAAQYATASQMMYKMFKLLNIDIDNKYIDVLSAVEEAKNEALKGGNCAKYNW